MADRPTRSRRDEPLLAFALATYNVTLFLLVPGLLVYWLGSLRSALSQIGTVSGIALFTMLLGGVTASLRQVAKAHSLADEPQARKLLVAGARWGGLIGLVLLGAAPAVAISVAALREAGLP
jgi:hypothetical protein